MMALIKKALLGYLGWFGLVHGTSIIERFLIPNPFLHTIVLFQTIQFRMCISFIYTQLNAKTVRFQTILFSIQIQFHFKQLSSPCVGTHKSTSLMSSSLLLQQCPACLVRQTWIVFVIGSRWPYSWCLVGCCCQDLFRIARSILV